MNFEKYISASKERANNTLEFSCPVFCRADSDLKISVPKKIQGLLLTLIGYCHICIPGGKCKL